MVNSIPSVAVPNNQSLNGTGAVPTDDELVAISAAVEAFISSELAEQQLLDLAAQRAASSHALSPWMVASRLEASKTSAPLTMPPLINKPWRNFLGSFLLATTLGAGSALLTPPPVLAQAAHSGAAADMTASGPQAYFGNFAGVGKGQTVKVMLGWPGQKVDLDLPDGGSIYAADGALVAKVGPRSAWTLNLARGGGNSSFGGARIVFSGKSDMDLGQSQASNQNLGQSKYQKASFLPPANGAKFGENRFALPSDQLNGGYLVVPDADSSGAPALVGVGGKLYRGCLLLRPMGPGANAGSSGGQTTSIAVINVVKIEDYLLSVVPSEVPSLWPQEVLKAQAIAARSYVVANLGKHKVDGYDVRDTVEDQVYKGVASESNETNVACSNTAGLVLKQNAQVISAFFHSTSGGSTELAENVYSKPLPYLKSVPDYDDAAPNFTWTRSFSSAQLTKTLGFSDADQLTGLFVVSRYKSDAQRVRHLVATGSGAGRLLTGGEVRKLLNLPSTQFSVYQADGAYVFSGRGYGHGLGLSQWGAKALADKGYNAGQILSYYYKDVTIESIGDLSGSNGSI